MASGRSGGCVRKGTRQGERVLTSIATQTSTNAVNKGRGSDLERSSSQRYQTCAAVVNITYEGVHQIVVDCSLY